MFGKKRKQEELEAAGAAAGRLLASDDLTELAKAAREIRDAWADAGFPEGRAAEVARGLEAASNC